MPKWIFREISNEIAGTKYILVDYLPNRVETTITYDYLKMLKELNQVTYGGVQHVNGIAVYEYILLPAQPGSN